MKTAKRTVLAIFAACASIACAFALAGCMASGTTDVSYNPETGGLTATFDGESDAIATSTMEAKRGFGICINPTLEAGSAQVTIIEDDYDDPVFDEEVSGELVNVEVNASTYYITVAGKKAKGSIEFYPYSIDGNAATE